LQIANSAWFATRQEVTDLKGAVRQLGLTTLRNLALGIGAFDAARSELRHHTKWVEQLQERALRTAKLAGSLVRRGQAANEAFLGGLLCNVGLLALATVSRDRLERSEAEAARSHAPLHQAEAKLWGCTHAEVGAALLGLWGLPFGVVETVLNHHAPERNVRDVLGPPQAVWIAASSVEGEPLDAAYLDKIGATELVRKIQQQGSEVKVGV
ncbi:MAG TPA: HDOD domain-containing protein, partial [Polyangiaceae bacterium]|nr:HDOD domain-containing protein [Polyangiaceae bacterium]